jgi:catechol 2,3-dioxygenase-like lactoylglutathione lyase family enzyme
MIAMIVPQFFSDSLPRTLAYYRDMLGFRTDFMHGDPPQFAGASRDSCLIYFRRVDALAPWPADKEESELLDAYLHVSDVATIYSEMQARRATILRPLCEMPWRQVEFVVRDCDGRLLCFGQEAAG